MVEIIDHTIQGNTVDKFTGLPVDECPFCGRPGERRGPHISPKTGQVYHEYVHVKTKAKWLPLFKIVSKHIVFNLKEA